MQFKDYLATFATIDHLEGLNVLDANGHIIHHIPAQEGKLGSLRLYHQLALHFDKTLDKKAARQGLEWFAEYVSEAKAQLGKHPNIDLLLQISEQDLHYTLQMIERS